MFLKICIPTGIFVLIIIAVIAVAVIFTFMISWNTLKAVQKMHDEQDNILHPPPGSESEFHG